jgi:hypothetical protein
MKQGSASGVQRATAIVGSESRNGWNKHQIAMATGLAFWVCGSRENGSSLPWLKVASGRELHKGDGLDGTESRANPGPNGSSHRGRAG